MADAAKEEAPEMFVQFQHNCDQMVFWINYKEVIVWPQELSDIKSEEAFQEKYAKFNEEINAQEKKVNETLNLAENLLQNKHPESDLIMRRREELKQSWQRMRKLALKRQHFGKELAEVQNAPAERISPVKAVSSKLKGLLEDLAHLQEFNLDCDATKTWVNKTLAVCTDDSHLDPHNLSQKVHNHAKLEEELASYKPHIDLLPKIQAHMKDLSKMWENLLKASERKGVQLAQAWQQEKFNHGVDNMIQWLSQMEVTLASPDFGTDLPTVENLIKDHTLVEQDVRTHREVMDIITTTVQQFIECGHFDLKNILARKVAVTDRFENMQRMMIKRQRKLADSLRAQQLYRDIGIEEEWINDKERVIMGRGKDIDTVKAMIRETQSILMEMHDHDPYVQKVITAGYKLADSGNYLPDYPSWITEAAIRERTKALADHWDDLKQKAFQRKQSNQLVLLFLFNIKD